MKSINGLALEHHVPKIKFYPYPLLFIHGMWGGSWNFQNYTTFTTKKGFEVYAVNLRGHQDSCPVENFGKVSVMDYVRDVLRIIEETGPVVLIGHSMGGLIAQKVASMMTISEVPGAVFITSAAPMGIPVITVPLLSRMLGSRYVASMLLNRAFIPYEDDARALLFNCMKEEEAHNATLSLFQESGCAAREVALGLINVKAKSVTCSTLVVGAEKDLMAPAHIQEKIAKKYDSDYILMHGHGHMLMLEEGWEQPISEVLEWVKSNIK